MGSKRNRNKKQSSRSWALIVLVFALVGGGWYAYQQYEDRVIDEENAILPPAPTLDPAMFVGRTRQAYQVARDIPDVLKHVHCFCGCKDGYNHRNNLFCFADQHGAVCDMCQAIAIESKRLYDAGKSTREITQLIDAQFGPGSH